MVVLISRHQFSSFDCFFFLAKGNHLLLSGYTNHCQNFTNSVFVTSSFLLLYYCIVCGVPSRAFNRRRCVIEYI